MAEPLNDEMRALFSRLRTQIENKRSRNVVREQYADGKKRIQHLGIAVPPQFQDIETVVGWPLKALTVPEARLDLMGFVSPNDVGVNPDVARIMDSSNMETQASTAHLSAYMHGVAFLEVVFTKGEGARILFHPATQATGDWDAREQRLTSALIESKLSPLGLVVGWTMYHGGIQYDVWFEGGRLVADELVVAAGVDVPVTALIRSPRTGKTWGQSRITRSVCSLTDQAVRNMLRTEVAAEFYAAPQKYLLGADLEMFTGADDKVRVGWEQYLSNLLVAPVNEEGTTPTAGTFPQMSIQPHSDHLRMIATMFAGEAGIPVSYLGVVHDNPASAEAIEAAESELVSSVERDQRTFGWGWVQAAQIALAYENGGVLPLSGQGLRAKWRDASTPSRSAASQNIMNLVTAGVYLPDSPITWEKLNLDETDIARLTAERRQRGAASSVAKLLEAGAAARQTPPPAEVA